MLNEVIVYFNIANSNKSSTT